MKSSAKQKIIEMLKQRILSMEMAPGVLLDEVVLSAEFGISRTPLREIIQRLSGEGYFELKENRGAKVASMDISTLRHFFQAAPMIYASISRLAAENATVEQIARLKDIQSAYRQSLNAAQPREIAMNNHRFHETIGEMAASAYLEPSLNRLLIDHTRIAQVFYRARTPDDRVRIEEASRQHDLMIEAFEAHAASDAVTLTLSHWDLSRGLMEAFVSPDPLPFTLQTLSKEKAHAV